MDFFPLKVSVDARLVKFYLALPGHVKIQIRPDSGWKVLVHRLFLLPNQSKVDCLYETPEANGIANDHNYPACADLSLAFYKVIAYRQRNSI